LADLLRLIVKTPVEVLLDKRRISKISVRLADGGGLSIYPGHAPLLAETVKGPLRYQDPAGEHELALGGGVLHVTREAVWLLVPGKLRREALPAVEAEEQRERFERLTQLLLASPDISPLESEDEASV
jgi:F0F1-type ATP synthase epsilon subunit